MAASFKDLKSLIENDLTQGYESKQSLDSLDKMFSEIVSDESQDLLPSLQLVEEFLIQSLDNHKMLKKVS